jgi:NADH-quinone oxidoreductase subunit H
MIPYNMTFELQRVLLIFFGLLGGCAYLYAFLGRKILADFQARVGPSLVGWYGFLQPFADAVKLLAKGAPARLSFFQTIWLHCYAMVMMSCLVALPLGFEPLEAISAGPLFFLVTGLVFTFGLALTALDGERVLLWYNATRVIHQGFISAFVLLLCILTVAVFVGDLSWNAFVVAQEFAPWTWTCFSSGFTFLACLMFLIAGPTLLMTLSMDSIFSPQQSLASLHSYIYGRRLLFFKLWQFFGILFWSTAAVTLFFGGWNLPEFVTHFLGAHEWMLLLKGLQLAVLLGKAMALLLLCSWWAAAIAQLHVEHIVSLLWRFCTPLACLSVIGVVLVRLLRGYA